MPTARQCPRLTVVLGFALGGLAFFGVGRPVPAADSPGSPELQMHVSVFMADYMADRYLLEARSVLTSPMGLSLIDRMARAVNDATPKNCVPPPPSPPPASGDKSADQTTVRNPDRDMVLALLAVAELIEDQRRAVMDIPLRDQRIKDALSPKDQALRDAIIAKPVAGEAAALREARLEADAAVELAIAFDRYLTREKLPVAGPLNPLETREGLALFDRLLEQIEDGFAGLMTAPGTREDFAQLMAFEAARGRALVDLPAGVDVMTAAIPFRPKLKHITAKLPALDTTEIWAPMEPVFKARCIERRPQRPAR